MNAAQSCALCATDELRERQREQARAKGQRMAWCSFCRAPLGVAELEVTPEPAWYRLLEAR